MLLTDPQLQDVRDALLARISAGLAKSGTEIACLPAYLKPPEPSCAGRAIVMDTGGTNMRAAMLDLAPGGASRLVAGPYSGPVEGGPEVTAEVFFDAQARLIVELEPGRGLPVGYCFSYPSETQPGLDARLLRWTKGIQVSGVEGHLVGSQLRDAIQRRDLSPGPVRVLNDTVACLLGGAHAFGAEHPEAFIGLIVGTGTNMAAFLRGDQIPKLREPFAGHMAVNFESGNFDPPHLGEADARIDATSVNPGAQRFEKAVSGFYLPMLFGAMLPEQPKLTSSADLVRMRAEATGAPQTVAAELLARSADLVAAALAAVIEKIDSPYSVGVLAEGSLFWGDPLYRDRVETTLRRLVENRPAPRIVRLERANLIGSAAAALVA